VRFTNFMVPEPLSTEAEIAEAQSTPCPVASVAYDDYTQSLITGDEAGYIKTWPLAAFFRLMTSGRRLHRRVSMYLVRVFVPRFSTVV
jgi:hypothetical protein